MTERPSAALAGRGHLHRAGVVTAGCFIVAAVVAGPTGCSGPLQTVVERLSESQRLAADLLTQFTKAADAANRAVMAGTDEASLAFAREAEHTSQIVEKDADALRPILVGLGYSKESRLLEEFGSRFAEYRALDRNILELAVEGSNLKAQRLSFGAAQEAADAFRDALASVAPLVPAEDWHVKALIATAVASVREIQVLQAAHIPESEEAAMTRLEKSMATSEATARGAIGKLAGLMGPESRPQLAAATAALDRFAGVNTQIVTLSRRNSNVRSLMLSLGQKRTLTAACEDSLRTLQEALAKRGFAPTR